MLSDERRSRSKLFPPFIWIKEPCVRKFEGLARSKLLGISQIKFVDLLHFRVELYFSKLLHIFWDALYIPVSGTSQTGPLMADFQSLKLCIVE